MASAAWLARWMHRLFYVLLLALPLSGWLLVSTSKITVPTLIFGAEAARRGAEGLATATPILMLAGITLGAAAILPFAAAAAIRVNLR